MEKLKNVKAICVDTNGDYICDFTPGKVYERVNGALIDNNGYPWTIPVRSDDPTEWFKHYDEYVKFKSIGVSKFKVGDRVTYILHTVYGPDEHLSGTVIGVNFDATKTNYYEYLVEFDKSFTCGHDGLGLKGYPKGKHGHCWYCVDSDLQHQTECAVEVNEPKRMATVYDLRRMCAYYRESNIRACRECPLYDIDCDPTTMNHHGCNLDELNNRVLKWCDEHPRKTRQSELMKTYPNMTLDVDGVISLCPGEFDTTCQGPDGFCSKMDSCHECRKKYWSEEVE